MPRPSPTHPPPHPSSGDTPPSLERGDLLVSASTLRTVYRRVGRVLVFVITPARASAASAVRAADDAALILVAAARSADVSADRIARRYPEAWLALALLLAGPPPPPGARVDAAAALAAARAALGGAVAAGDDTMLAPLAVSSAGASAAAGAALRGALTSALRRPPSPGRPSTPPPGAPPPPPPPGRRGGGGRGGACRCRRERWTRVCLWWVVGRRARRQRQQPRWLLQPRPTPPPRAPDDVSMLMEMVGGEAGPAPAPAAPTGWAPTFDDAPSAAFPPVSLLTAAPATVSAAAAEGWASFDAAPAVAVSASARPPTDEEAAAVATGAAFTLLETWRGAFEGDRLAAAGVAGEVRVAGAAARAVGATLPAQVALLPPPVPHPDTAAAVVVAGLRCARADPGLVDSATTTTQRGRGVVVAVGAAAATARPPLLYRLPAVAVPPPLVARLRLTPAPGGAAGGVLSVEWCVATTAPRFATGSITLTLPEAAGDIVRVTPRAAWHPPSRTLTWRVGGVRAGATGSVRCAFGPPSGAPPDALAACGVPGGGPAAAARGAAAVLELRGGGGGVTGARVASGGGRVPRRRPAPRHRGRRGEGRPERGAGRVRWDGWRGGGGGGGSASAGFSCCRRHSARRN